MDYLLSREFDADMSARGRVAATSTASVEEFALWREAHI